MAKPRRNHYIPLFYLKGFCREGRLWVFDRSQLKYLNPTPKNTAVESEFYSYDKLDGTGVLNTDLEDYWGITENRAAPALRKLIGRDALSKPELSAVRAFVLAMYLRVPAFELSMRGRVEECGMPAELITDGVRGHFSRRSMKTLFEYTPLHEGLAECRLLILHSPPHYSFVTTDNPVVHVPEGHYLASRIPGVSGLLSLNLRSCLALVEVGAPIQHISIEIPDVRDINLHIAQNSHRLLIARDEKLVRSIVKTCRLNRRRDISLG